MKKHHALAMALSALTAGLLISCVKPTEDNNQNDGNTSDAATETVSASDAASDAAANDSVDNDAADNDDATNDGVANQPQTHQLAADISPISLSDETVQTYLTHVANEVVIPAYHDAAKQSDELHQLAQKYCAAGTVPAEPLQQLRAQWLTLAQAWASAEMINFGPATQSMSHLYINYYPDERGLVHNGVAELIAANPKLTAEQLAQESAIVQGVPGLEEVLYANDTLNASQCAYVISASAALTTRLKDIERQWQKDGHSLLAIDQVATTDQGLNQWVNSLLSLIETMKSSAVDQPLGLSGKTKGHVPAATAGQSRAIINAKIATLNQALTDPVLTAILNNSEQGHVVGNELSTALAETTTLLAQMPEDISKADKANQQQLLADLTKVTQIIKHQLIPLLGIRVGFNSTDGD